MKNKSKLNFFFRFWWVTDPPGFATGLGLSDQSLPSALPEDLPQRVGSRLECVGRGRENNLKVNGLQKRVDFFFKQQLLVESSQVRGNKLPTSPSPRCLFVNIPELGGGGGGGRLGEGNLPPDPSSLSKAAVDPQTSMALCVWGVCV